MGGAPQADLGTLSTSSPHHPYGVPPLYLIPIALTCSPDNSLSPGVANCQENVDTNKRDRVPPADSVRPLRTSDTVELGLDRSIEPERTSRNRPKDAHRPARPPGRQNHPDSSNTARTSPPSPADEGAEGTGVRPRREPDMAFPRAARMAMKGPPSRSAAAHTEASDVCTNSHHGVGQLPTVFAGPAQRKSDEARTTAGEPSNDAARGPGIAYGGGVPCESLHLPAPNPPGFAAIRRHSEIGRQNVVEPQRHVWGPGMVGAGSSVLGGTWSARPLAWSPQDPSSPPPADDSAAFPWRGYVYGKARRTFTTLEYAFAVPPVRLTVLTRRRALCQTDSRRLPERRNDDVGSLD
ncbi:hypothetical protein V8D89_011072 [Ganoderma adspersum]